MIISIHKHNKQNDVSLYTHYEGNGCVFHTS